MRYMMLMIPRVYQGGNGQSVPADFMPNEGEVARMTEYNEELSKAGVLLELDGLHPPAKGGRVTFRGGRPVIEMGPHPDGKNVLGGYWIVDVKSLDDALAWARRCPAQDGDVIEIRQIFELSDFPPEVQRAAALETAPVRTGREKHR